MATWALYVQIKSNHSYVQVHICLLKKNPNKQQRTVGAPVQRCARFPRKQEGQLVMKEGFLSLLQKTSARLFSHYCFEHQHKFRNGLIWNYTCSSLKYIHSSLYFTASFCWDTEVQDALQLGLAFSPKSLLTNTFIVLKGLWHIWNVALASLQS